MYDEFGDGYREPATALSLAWSLGQVSRKNLASCDSTLYLEEQLGSSYKYHLFKVVKDPIFVNGTICQFYKYMYYAMIYIYALLVMIKLCKIDVQSLKYCETNITLLF